ncbi:MAG: carboxypeptidase regulatory-like domain-containing protein [Archangiaceae bacterium]|nr:carboxypeptidase regulatory-like domain-containing protein [Archangiaceae bacterium]
MNRRNTLGIVALLVITAAALVLFIVHDPEQRQPLPGVRPTSSAPITAFAPPSQRLPEPPAPPREQPTSAVREELPSAPQGEIEGRVLSNETRRGIAVADVTWANERGAHPVRTDGDGHFVFRPPHAGLFQLASVKADGYLPFGPEWGKSPVQVAFRPGQRVRGVVIELTPSPDLTGRVVDAAGDPVQGATARVLTPRRDEAALFPMRDHFTTDARGAFIFHAEPFAMLEAFHPTRGSGRARLERGAREVVITLQAAPADAGVRGVIAGRVVAQGRPVAGALVHVGSSLRAYPQVFGSPDGYRELTDVDGRFEIDELMPGSYDVSAHLLGLAPVHRYDIHSPTRDLTLELGAGPRLSGRVTEEGKAPVPAFEVALWWRKAPLERVQIVEAGFVDPDGRYLIEGVAPGAYELSVSARGYSPSMVRVTLGPGDGTADVTLQRGVRTRGTVRSADARLPISGARVADEQGGPTTLTDGAGVFALEGLPAGGYSLQVSASGFNTRVLTVTDSSAELDVELTRAPSDGGVKVELYGIGAVLRGRGDALVIGEVMPGAGAASAGLGPGDEVVSVDGRAVAELGFEASIRAIRGPVESVVTLEVRKSGSSPARAVQVTRRKVVN